MSGNHAVQESDAELDLRRSDRRAALFAGLLFIMSERVVSQLDGLPEASGEQLRRIANDGLPDYMASYPEEVLAPASIRLHLGDPHEAQHAVRPNRTRR
jgi:hypothetical protein